MTTSIVFSLIGHVSLAAGGTARTGLTVPETVLLFVGAPLGLFLLITAVVMRPGSAGGTRYRPGREWAAGESWFGAEPAAGAAAGSSTGPGSEAAGAPEHEAPGGSTGAW